MRSISTNLLLFDTNPSHQSNLLHVHGPLNDQQATGRAERFYSSRTIIDEISEDSRCVSRIAPVLLYRHVCNALSSDYSPTALCPFRCGAPAPAEIALLRDGMRNWDAGGLLFPQASVGKIQVELNSKKGLQMRSRNDLDDCQSLIILPNVIHEKRLGHPRS